MVKNDPGPKRCLLTKIIQGIIFLLIFFGSLVTFLIALPLLKEGYGIGQLPVFTGLAGGLLLTVWFWRRFGTGRLRSAGTCILVLAMVPHLLISADLVLDEWRALSISRQIRITSFNAHPIVLG